MPGKIASHSAGTGNDRKRTGVCGRCDHGMDSPADERKGVMMEQKKESEKTATYRQLMGNKLQYQNMLSLYQIYGLLDDEKHVD